MGVQHMWYRVLLPKASISRRWFLCHLAIRCKGFVFGAFWRKWFFPWIGPEESKRNLPPWLMVPRLILCFVFSPNNWIGATKVGVLYKILSSVIPISSIALPICTFLFVGSCSEYLIDKSKKWNLSTKYVIGGVDTLKSVYLALREATKKWSMPIRNWGIVLNQFTLIFEKRLRL